MKFKDVEVGEHVIPEVLEFVGGGAYENSRVVIKLHAAPAPCGGSYNAITIDHHITSVPEDVTVRREGRWRRLTRCLS
jgi:hypothetical protein